jgi:DNA modification methylase
MGFKDWLDYKDNHRVDQEEEYERRFLAQEQKKPWDPNKKKCIGNTWFIPYTPISKLAKQAGSDTLGDKTTGKGGHPATFPEQLPDMCIKFSGIPKGSTVYDPFAGTGTTVVAADKNGMHGIGTDIDDNYLEFAKKRFVDTVVELI